MNNSMAFGKNSDSKAISRFMDTAPKTERIYLFNPEDAKRMTDKAKRDGLKMKVNYVETDDGMKPWTRRIDLDETNPLMRSVHQMGKKSEGEHFVFHGKRVDSDLNEGSKLVDPASFEKEHLMNHEVESAYSM